MPADGSFHKLVHATRKSDMLMVVFSHAADRPPRFSLYESALASGANVLFLNDELSGWYTRGVPSIGPTHRDVVSAIEHMAKICGATRIACVGASMGGYGAIRYAKSLGAQSCLATDFEVRLGIRGSRSSLMGSISYGGYMTDVASMIPKGAMLLHSKSDIFDMLSASLVPATSGARVVGVSSQKHGSIIKMNSDGLLAPALKCIVNNEPISVPYESSLWMQNDYYSGLFFHMHSLYEAGAFAELCDYVGSLDSEQKEIPIVSFTHAMATYKTGDVRGAKDIMAFTNKVSGDWTEPLAMLGVFSFRMGELALAAEYLEQSVSKGGVNSMVWSQLGEVYEKIGNFSKALSAYNRASEINPNSPVYKKSVARVTSLIGS